MAKLSVMDVAKRLGKDPWIVREYIKMGLYPFAVAIRPEGRIKWDFTIFPAKFEEYCATGGRPDLSKLEKPVEGEEDDEDERYV